MPKDRERVINERLNKLEEECGKDNCRLVLVDVEDDGKGSVELFCRSCMLNIIGDSLTEIEEECKGVYTEEI